MPYVWINIDIKKLRFFFFFSGYTQPTAMSKETLDRCDGHLLVKIQLWNFPALTQWGLTEGIDLWPPSQHVNVGSWKDVLWVTAGAQHNIYKTIKTEILYGNVYVRYGLGKQVLNAINCVQPLTYWDRSVEGCQGNWTLILNLVLHITESDSHWNVLSTDGNRIHLQKWWKIACLSSLFQRCINMLRCNQL